MNVPVLVIKLHGQRLGHLFKFEQTGSPPVIRFVVDWDYATAPFASRGVLSESFRAPSPEQQASFWLDVQASIFNGCRSGVGEWQLPAYFQNLLPEGAFRRHIASEAAIDPHDHFAMLAACGKNLSGAVTAEWEQVKRADLQRLITQDQDALEMSVWAEPFQGAISISGVQPKLALTTDASGRFVGRTSQGDAHVIAKLPSAEYPRMPQVEDLCMRLAQLAGVQTCSFALHPMSLLGAPHRYDLGEEIQGEFLAVNRFDRIKQRGVTRRVHFEDFAQVLSTSPDRKYEGSYFDIAVTLLLLPGCGEPAVHELLRRIEVNELLGNADMHLKNIGLLYPDGVTATLAPAYDITSTAVLVGSRGHALQLLPGARNNMTGLLSARTVKDLCDALPIGYPRANKIVRDTALAAARAWLQPIVDSGITPRQKAALIGHFVSSAHGAGVLRIKAHARLADDWQRALMAQRQLAGL